MASRLGEQDAAQLIWDSAEGLAPKDRLVLDLHLRHGLAGQELADSLEVTRQNAYALLDKMRRALSRSAGALLVARYRRRECETLDELLAGWDGHYHPLIRKRVARHVDSCNVCERSKAALIAPERLFSAVPIVVAPAALKDRVMDALGPSPTTRSTAEPDASVGGGSRFGVRAAGLLAVVGGVVVAGIVAVTAFGSGVSQQAPTATSFAPNSTVSVTMPPVSGSPGSTDRTAPSDRAADTAATVTSGASTTSEQITTRRTPADEPTSAPSTIVASTTAVTVAAANDPSPITVTTSSVASPASTTSVSPATTAATSTTVTAPTTTTSTTTTTTTTTTTVVAGPGGGG